MRFLCCLFVCISFVVQSPPSDATLEELIQQLLNFNIQGAEGGIDAQNEFPDIELQDLGHAVEDALHDVPTSTDHALEAVFLDDNAGVPPPIATRDQIRNFSESREGEPWVYRRVISRRRGESMREAPRPYRPVHYVACGALATCGFCLAGMVIASQVLKIQYDAGDKN